MRAKLQLLVQLTIKIQRIVSEIQYFFATLQVECIAFLYFCCLHGKLPCII